MLLGGESATRRRKSTRALSATRRRDCYLEERLLLEESATRR